MGEHSDSSMETAGATADATAGPQKLSRKKYLALRKKERRKRRRQALARLRENWHRKRRKKILLLKKND